MRTSTSNEPNDRESVKQMVKPVVISGRAEVAIRCRLCRETIELETNFRPHTVTCPHCRLRFVFDPEQEPLPVTGLRLHYSAVREAQQRPGGVRHKRHDAHLRPTVQLPRPTTNYLAWAGGLALTLAAAMFFFGGWLHHWLGR